MNQIITLLKYYKHLCNLSCPIKHCKLKYNNKTWFTNGLKNACRKKKIYMLNLRQILLCIMKINTKSIKIS